MIYRGPLTPKQAAAFWKLGVLNGDDLRRLAMQWLEEGHPSDSVAVLAGERDPTLREDGALFARCLTELGASVASEREAAWIYAQALLQATQESFDSWDALQDLLVLFYRGISLFPPRNLASEGQAFAGEELGFEKLLGLYYELDVLDPRHPAGRRLREDIKVECKRLLSAFYTDPPPYVRLT